MPCLVRGAPMGFRSNSNSNSNNPSGIRSESPYDILGIPKTATYAEAKRKFLELALEHHPDHATEGSSPGTFVRFKDAFDHLRKDHGNGRSSRSGDDDAWTDQEFRAWYYDELARNKSSEACVTSTTTVQLDAKTRQEVIDVVNKSSQGGLDRGGIWEWARRLAEEDANLMDTKHKYKRTVGLDQRPADNNNKSLQRRSRKKR